MTIEEVLSDIFYGDEADSYPLTVNSRYLGDTALHKAMRLGRFDYVKILLTHGAGINASGDMGFTPLHEAVAEDHTAIAEFLLSEGADVSLKSEFDKTALQLIRSDGMRRLFKSFFPAELDLKRNRRSKEK